MGQIPANAKLRLANLYAAMTTIYFYFSIYNVTLHVYLFEPDT